MALYKPEEWSKELEDEVLEKLSDLLDEHNDMMHYFRDTLLPHSIQFLVGELGEEDDDDDSDEDDDNELAEFDEEDDDYESEE